MSSSRMIFCCVWILSLCATLGSFGCADSNTEYETPSDALAKGSSHPALAEKVVAAASNPHGANPHGANPHGANPHGANPHAAGATANPHGGGTSGGFGGQGAEIPADWKPGEAISIPLRQPSVTFVPDAAWKRERPRNNLREAQFIFPHADNDQHDGEMWVSAAMGDFDSNVQRWQGSFSERPEPKVTDMSANGIEIKLIELQGTYQWRASFRSPAEPRAGYGMIVAMVNRSLFFRFIGPQATIEKWRASFETMLQGLTPAR